MSMMIREVVASQDLWIWHAYYGVANLNNESNILYTLTLFDDTYHGTTLECSFM